MTIFSRLQGGLGNQMFQYAIARSLSEHYHVDFALNSGWFNRPDDQATPRELEITQLNIQNVPITDDFFPEKPRKLQRSLQRILPTRNAVFYQHNAFNFDGTLFNLKKVSHRNIYLSGYWQAYPYIDSIRQKLKSEFQIKSNLLNPYKDYLGMIQSTESVMLHIRRGDYVHSPAAAKYHGSLPISYYQNAIQDLKSSRPSAYFYVFSDDLEWAKKSLNNSIPITYIEHGQFSNETAHELQLMFACKHHIIANSSLSWWGAWLKSQTDGIVYAPNRWTNDTSLDLTNLLPANWKRISF